MVGCGARLRQRHYLLVGAERRLRQELGVEDVDDRLRRQHILRRVRRGGHLRGDALALAKSEHGRGDEDGERNGADRASQHKALLEVGGL